MKKEFLIAALMAGSLGAAYAQTSTPAAGTQTPQMSAQEEQHPRVFEVKDRIADQRERIDNGLKDKTLTDDQAKACRDVVDSVETQMKADYQTNGSEKLTADQTAALNKLLDANSAILHEEKQAGSQ
jgi:hypothetical protein